MRNRKTEYFLIIVLSFLMLQDLTIYAQQSRSANDIVTQLYDYHKSYLAGKNSNNGAGMVNSTTSMRLLYDSLNKDEADNVNTLLLEDFFKCTDNKENNSFLLTAERILWILPSNSPFRFDILNTMADYYWKCNNREMLGSTLAQMKGMQESEYGDNPLIIQQYLEKFNLMMPFKESLNGVWICNYFSLDPNRYGQPLLIFNIFDNETEKYAYLTPISAFETKKMNDKKSLLRLSNAFQFDIKNGSFLFEFYEFESHRGDAGIAQAYYNSAQSTRASFHALAEQPGASLGQSLTAEIVGGVMATGWELLGNKAAVSTMSEDKMYFTGIRNTPDIFNTHVTYRHQEMNSVSMKNNVSNLIDRDLECWRWKEEYNIVFSTANCRPISPYVRFIKPNTELYQVRKETSIFKAKYMLPMLAGLSASAGLFIWGTSFFPDKPGWGLGLCGLGLAGASVSIIVPFNIQKENRKKVVGEYNKRTMDHFYDINHKNN